MDNYFTTFPPLVVAETWVVAVVSTVIIVCFIFLIVLLVLSHKAKSAIPKPYTNVRRKIFYAEPKNNETKVTTSTTESSNQSSAPIVLNSVVPYAPVAMVPPIPLPPPPPPPLLRRLRLPIFRRARRAFVPVPVPVPVPVSYYPGRMFAKNMPRRYYPYRAIV